MNLTDQKILAALRRPSNLDRQLGDAHGLSLRIRAGSSIGTFQTRFTLHGRPRKISIGNYPGVTLEDARALHFEIRKSVRDGHDPIRARREKRLAERTAATVADLWDEYLEAHLKIHCTPASVAEITGLIRLDVLPVIGKVPLRELTQRDIVLLLDRPKRRHAPVTANRLLSAVRAMIRFASVAGWSNSIRP